MLILLHFVLNSNLIRFSKLGWFTLEFLCGSCLPWMNISLVLGVFLSRQHLGEQSYLFILGQEVACPEDQQLPPCGRGRSRWGKRPHATKSLANFPPSSAWGCQPGWIPQGDFFHCEQLSQDSKLGSHFRNLALPLRSRVDGCQVCIGDKKAPKRDDESGGTGVKGAPSVGVGVGTAWSLQPSL